MVPNQSGTTQTGIVGCVTVLGVARVVRVVRVIDSTTAAVIDILRALDRTVMIQMMI